MNKPTRTCSIDGCEHKHKGRGFCAMHLRRLKTSGDVGGASPLRNLDHSDTCIVEGCLRPFRTKGYCTMHYARLLNSGDVGGPQRTLQRYATTECTVDGCTKRRSTGAYCPMHATRVRKYGDPHKVIVQRWDKEHHPNWVGDDVSYAGAHSRVREWRGRAKDLPCVDCGKPAWDWSYTYQDPNEKREFRDGALYVYGPDPDYYAPRCRSCHSVFDAPYRAALESAHATN